MNENETAPAAATAAPAEAKPAKAKKTQKKTKAQPKKVAATKSGVLRPQLRILEALASPKWKTGATKEQLSKAAGVHMNWIAEYVGVPDKGSLVSDTVRGAKKLACAGLVRIEVMNDDGAQGERNYLITASGKKVVERARKEGKA